MGYEKKINQRNHKIVFNWLSSKTVELNKIMIKSGVYM